VLLTRYPGSPNPTARSLGTVGAITLETARVKAREWIELIGKGLDPEVQATTKRQETFKAISGDYFLRRAKDHRSRAWSEAALARLVYPTLGSRPISAISRIEVVRLLDRIEDERGPVMANRTYSMINRVMNFHASRSDDFRSPLIRGMRPTEQARSRILSDDELRAIWKASGDHLFGTMLRFILLTATRRNEAGQAKHSEIIGTDWTIPAAS
jgi:integrase